MIKYIILEKNKYDSNYFENVKIDGTDLFGKKEHKNIEAQEIKIFEAKSFGIKLFNSLEDAKIYLKNNTAFKTEDYDIRRIKIY